eukprot:12922213-Prorocentrum_lima.AAC.1
MSRAKLPAFYKGDEELVSRITALKQEAKRYVRNPDCPGSSYRVYLSPLMVGMPKQRLHEICC